VRVTGEAVDRALEVIRPALAADGFDLRAGTVEDDTVEVILEALSDACMECLVPGDLLAQIVTDAVEAHVGKMATLRLTKIGFDGAGTR
jgi:Fe-S cluster biogenesis protein NfuA